MNSPSNLKVDKMPVDTELALHYFKKQNNQFESLTSKSFESTAEVSDGYNTICYTNIQSFESEVICVQRSIDSEDGVNLKYKILFFNLAKEIEKNGELFGQIEYLIRKKSIDEVKMYDIKLINSNLMYNATSEIHFNGRSSDTLIMESDTPLACLGYVAQIYARRGYCRIVATAETAVVSYLFMELCRISGLTRVWLWLIEKPSLESNFNYNGIFKTGCVGVVTGQADVDSAVDTFIDSTSKYPWRLTRILVQECVYDAFKKALQWKCRDGDESVTASCHTKLCAAVYTHADKKFLVDYTGANANSPGITVEAYRTTKELFSLIPKDGPYMSLWSNDADVSNEIAHSTHSPTMIWVNQPCGFDGPAMSSQAFYGLLDSVTSHSNLEHVLEHVDDLRAIQKDWLKNSFEDRRNTVYQLLLSFAHVNKLFEVSGFQAVLCGLLNWNGDDIVRVENDRICICKAYPVSDVRILDWTPYNALSVVKIMVLGTPLDFFKVDDMFKDLLPMLMDAGVPVSYISMLTFLGCVFRKVKVVWSNHGTVFAN